MEKLKVEELTPYLPFKLKCFVVNDGKEQVGTLSAVYDNGECVFHDIVEAQQGFESVKPLLRPLSYLTKEIEHNGEKFVPIRKLLEANNFNLEKMETEYINSFAKSMVEIQIAYDDAQLLLRWHFDIFGLIEKGLAIDINTLKS